jgi:hypothetical protein
MTLGCKIFPVKIIYRKSADYVGASTFAHGNASLDAKMLQHLGQHIGQIRGCWWETVTENR